LSQTQPQIQDFSKQELKLLKNMIEQYADTNRAIVKSTLDKIEEKIKIS